MSIKDLIHDYERGNGNGDSEPVTNPTARELHDAARAVRDDDIVAMLRAIRDELDVVQAHQRSQEAMLFGMRAVVDHLDQERERPISQIAALRNDLERHRRETEQRRIEGARASSPNLDAQALAVTLTSLERKFDGAFEGQKLATARLEKSIGAAEDSNLGVQGSGLLGRLQTIEHKAKIIVAVAAALASLSAVAGGVIGLLKLLNH